MELWSAEKVLVKGRFEKDWGVAVDQEGMIQAVGPRAQLVAGARRVHHHPDKILLPAFVNPHHHGFDRLFRPLTDLDLPYNQLLNKVIWPLSGSTNHNLFDAVYRVALAEQAMAGVGTVGEFLYLHNGVYETGRAAFAERLIRIATDLGIRLSLVYTFFDQGAEEVRPFVQPMDLSIQEYEALAQRYGGHPLINILPGIHGLAHTSPDAVIAAAELAEKYDTPFHIQLAADQEDLKTAKVHYDTTPLRALDKMGVVNGRLVVVHGTLLEEEELNLLEEHGAAMILCPTAVMTRGARGPNTSALLNHGIPFAVASGTLPMFNSYSATEEIKMLELTQRESEETRNVLNTRMGISSLWELSTVLPSRMLGLDTSRFMPGTPADFMLVSQASPSNKPSFNDGRQPYAMNELMFGWGAQSSVSHLFVQGKTVVSNGQFAIDMTASYRLLEKKCDAFLEDIRKDAPAN
ncbi:MAG: amidohydrolase family protein [Acidobacteriota bacterium]|nr:amidohydrolase family protein [Acidobacteriota bacterium]